MRAATCAAPPCRTTPSSGRKSTCASPVSSVKNQAHKGLEKSIKATVQNQLSFDPRPSFWEEISSFNELCDNASWSRCERTSSVSPFPLSRSRKSDHLRRSGLRPAQRHSLCIPGFGGLLQLLRLLRIPPAALVGLPRRLGGQRVAGLRRRTPFELPRRVP